MENFISASREWHELLRDVGENFISLHLDMAMQLALALHCRNDTEAARIADTVSSTDQRNFTALSLILRQLIEAVEREHMAFLLPVTDVEVTSSATLKTERTRRESLLNKLPPAFEQRFRDLLATHWSALSPSKPSNFPLPRLKQLNWKVDSKEDGRSILIRLQLSDGRTRTMLVPINQFHELRHSVASVLQEMNQVKAHPIMRLVSMEQSEPSDASNV